MRQSQLTETNSKVDGYHCWFLRIDATRERGDFVSLPVDVLRRFIGGSGLGVYLLLKENAAEVEPTSPDASIAFVFSPMVGSPLTTSAKFAVVSKSPLTNRINDSLASSGFAIAGKKTGCDAMVITGRAAQPSILMINNGEITFAPADDLWGTECDDAQHQLRDRFGGDWQFAVIGPAGERQVRYATISHDGRHAGRGGSGAVLGSKNIKAIAVRGNHRSKWAKPKELAVYAKRLSEKSFGPATAKYRELGTASNLLVFNRLNALPTKNFQQGSFEGAANISPESLSVGRTKTQVSCAACTIGCEHIYATSTDDNLQPSDGVRVEYESLFALGPLCGIDDSDAVLAASKKCDQLGLDTISAGGTIAFAMECVERGMLDASWLQFGSGDALLRALDEIGQRQGLGDQLAEGSLRFANRVGQNSLSFAPQVKGLEIPGYEPRALQTMALGFAVGTRGADHNRSGAYKVDFSDQVDRRNVKPEAAPLAIETEDKAALMDSLVLCKFLRGVFTDFFTDAAEMLNLITGWDTTSQEMRQASQRIVTAKKLFNIRAGWTPSEDTLPDRFLSQTLSDDERASLLHGTLAELVASYNQNRGWSSEGWLDASVLQHHGLDDIQFPLST